MVAGARSERYVTLDGMRGIAALSVAQWHFSFRDPQSAYLAVDFFFALSGFVLWKAYSRDLAEGTLSASRFLLLRVMRLYPLYVLGLAIAVLFMLQRELRGIEPGVLAASAPALVTGSLMLPAPFGDALYPFNTPSWSLFFELLANLLMGLVMAMITWRRAVSLALASSAILICCIWLFASRAIPLPGEMDFVTLINTGYTWSTWYIGLLRVMVSFPIGLALAHLKTSPKLSSLAAIGLWTLLALSMFFSPRHLWRLGYDGLFVLCISPLLIWLGANHAPHPRIAPAAGFLGDISYAIYALHMPVMLYVLAISARLGLSQASSNLLYIVFVLAGSTVATRAYDKPIRRFLAGRTRISGIRTTTS